MTPPIRTIEMAISKELISQFISEKMEQFGFKADEDIIRIDLKGLPDIIPMHVKFKKEQEVKFTIHAEGKA